MFGALVLTAAALFLLGALLYALAVLWEVRRER